MRPGPLGHDSLPSDGPSRSQPTMRQLGLAQRLGLAVVTSHLAQSCGPVRFGAWVSRGIKGGRGHRVKP
jgi:hypothetical protein